MARPSKIDRLPQEIKAAIGELRQSGHTIDEILAKLRELKPDIDISRTGLHVHVQRIDSISEAMQKTRVIAEAVAAKLDGASQTQVARLNVEILHGLIFDLLTQSEQGGEVKIDAKQGLLLARALQSLNSGTKTLADMEIKIRREAAEKTIAAVERAIEGSEIGDKKKLIEEIRTTIYGLPG